MKDSRRCASVRDARQPIPIEEGPLVKDMGPANEAVRRQAHEHRATLAADDIRRGMWATVAVALASAACVMATGAWAAAAVGGGACIALVPMGTRIVRDCPRNDDELLALTRGGKMYFNAWLAIMVCYVIAGLPLGYAVFEVISTIVLSGVFFRRVVLRGLTHAIWHWRSSATLDSSTLN